MGVSKGFLFQCQDQLLLTSGQMQNTSVIPPEIAPQGDLKVTESGNLIYSIKETSTGTQYSRKVYSSNLDTPPNLLNDLSYTSLEGRDLETIILGEKLIFENTGNDDLPQLWVTDGSSSGTIPIANLSIPDFANYGIIRYGNTAFFRGRANSIASLWRTDGTPAGTVWLVMQGVPRTLNEPASPRPAPTQRAAPRRARPTAVAAGRPPAAGRQSTSACPPSAGRPQCSPACRAPPPAGA